MQQLRAINQEEFELNHSIEELENVNREIANLMLRKEELTKEIIESFGHSHDGQITYEYGIYKITCKTPMVYSLNKKLYESGEVKLPKKFNPIKESISYRVDKKLCDEYMINAPDHVRVALGELIEVDLGKPSVSIKGRES